MKPALRVMIVEDEPLATRRLVRLLREEEGCEVVAAAENGREALEIIGAVRPDLLLLDVEMPGINGFDLLRALPEGMRPAVVFVTAFDSYAVKAFDARAVDFVLKPVVAERLSAALEQARRDLASRDVERKFATLQSLVDELRRKAPADGDGYERDIWAQQRSEAIRIPVEEIDWIEAEKDYVRVHAAAKSHLVYGSMSSIQEKLDPRLFMRVHRSAIVRLDRVRSVSRGVYGTIDLLLTSGHAVRVGRKYGSEVRARLG